LNVLILHWGARGGGPQLQCEISAALSRRTDVQVALSFDGASEMSAKLSPLRVPTLRVGSLAARFRHFRGPLRLFAQPIDAARLCFFCRRHGIDIVFEPMGNPLQNFPRWCIRRFGIKAIISVHDAVRHPGEESHILTWLAARSVKDCDGVMTYSAAVADQLRELGVPVFTTVHGAFGRTRRDSPRSVPRGKVVIGFFGRLERYKGIRRLAETVVLLRARGHDVHAKLVGRGVIAPADLELLESVNAEVDNRWVQEEEIVGIIGSFDILALPYDEASQSGVVGFALREGVPIVATPVGGLKEQVHAGGGLVARGMGVGEYADEIESILRDPSRYRAVSAAEILAAMLEFSWERVAEDIVSAARQVCQCRDTRT